jgi:signal transduction histidine kinase
MTFDQFSQYLTWAIYIIIFCIVGAKAAQRPTQANIDIALLFAVPALSIGISLANSLQIIQPNPTTAAITSAISTSLLIALSYMLFRLVDDFTAVPGWLVRSAPAVLAVFVVSNFLIAPPRPQWFTTLELLYGIILFIYTSVKFIRESSRSSGVTMRRMRAVAFGSITLCALFLLVVVLIFFPGTIRSLIWLVDLTELGSGFMYYLGFATPGTLRRAWQEPELRAFLGRAASLPRLPDTESIIRELERGAASAVGAPEARVGLWDDTIKRLRFKMDGTYFDSDPNRSLSGRVFLTQKPLFSDNIARDNPPNIDVSRPRDAVALLSAPITAGEKRLGVLTVYSTRAPIFAEEDLELVRLLADQAAVILESRALIDEAARVRAREEVTRLKEDFLSAAAHDLKTPLTILVMQTEMLERRAQRSPDAPVDITALQKLKKEAYRLKDLVLELLDAARAEQGKLIGEFEEVDLVAYAREVCERRSTRRHPCSVHADGEVPGVYDPNRIVQLIENLVENAIKYSPDGGPVTIRIWQDRSNQEPEIRYQSLSIHNPQSTIHNWNHLTVTDTGIGIPKEDLPNVFERFHRGSNVDDRHFAGMGLGLFICHGIVEQHGGRIWVESPASTLSHVTDGHNGHNDGALPGMGSSSEILYSRDNHHNDDGHISFDLSRQHTGTTFHVALPALPTIESPEPAEIGASQGQPGGENAV